MASGIGLNNLEFLYVLVCNLSDSVHIWVTVDFYKAASLAWLKSYKSACGVAILTADLESKEVTSAPIINDLAWSIEIFNGTCNLAVFNFYICAL